MIVWAGSYLKDTSFFRVFSRSHLLLCESSLTTGFSSVMAAGSATLRLSWELPEGDQLFQVVGHELAAQVDAPGTRL